MDMLAIVIYYAMIRSYADHQMCILVQAVYPKLYLVMHLDQASLSILHA